MRSEEYRPPSGGSNFAADGTSPTMDLLLNDMMQGYNFTPEDFEETADTEARRGAALIAQALIEIMDSDDEDTDERSEGEREREAEEEWVTGTFCASFCVPLLMYLPDRALPDDENDEDNQHRKKRPRYEKDYESRKWFPWSDKIVSLAINISIALQLTTFRLVL